jgi:ribonuclease VapC
MIECVLDASAIIALFKQEPGWETVADVMPNGCASAVNFAEVVEWMSRAARPEHEIFAEVNALRFAVFDFDRPRAMAAGLLARQTRRLGLSLGDRACLALASELGLPVVSADRPWQGLDLGVEIRLIR